MRDNTKRKIKKIAKAILIAFIFLYGIKWISTNIYPYNFSNPIVTVKDQTETLHSLGRVSTPINYELKDVGKGRKGENVMVV